MKISNKKVLETVNYLRALEGTESQRFKFGAFTVWILVRNLRKFADLAEDLEKTRIKLIQKHGIKPRKDDQTKLDTSDLNFKEFQDEWTKLLEEEVIVEGIKNIKASELKLDINNVPLTLLTELNWMIDDDMDVVAEKVEKAEKPKS